MKFTQWMGCLMLVACGGPLAQGCPPNGCVPQAQLVSPQAVLAPQAVAVPQAVAGPHAFAVPQAFGVHVATVPACAVHQAVVAQAIVPQAVAVSTCVAPSVALSAVPLAVPVHAGPLVATRVHTVNVQALGRVRQRTVVRPFALFPRLRGW